MLYEVITHFAGLELVCLGNFFICHRVITSYSIHYTKLYEKLSGDQKSLIKTAIGAAVYVVAIITRVEGSLVSLGLFLAAYFIIGGNVVWRAVRNILHGKVFDENFLMSIATIGAFIVGA